MPPIGNRVIITIIINDYTHRLDSIDKKINNSIIAYHELDIHFLCEVSLTTKSRSKIGKG